MRNSLKNFGRITGVTLAVSMFFPALALAQTYGSGVYGLSTYGNGVIKIGPIILPVTGANIALLIGSALALSFGIGYLVWERQKRKSKPAT